MTFAETRLEAPAGASSREGGNAWFTKLTNTNASMEPKGEVKRDVKIREDSKLFRLRGEGRDARFTKLITRTRVCSQKER